MLGIIFSIALELQLRQPGSIFVTSLYAWLALLPRDFVVRRPIVLARHVAPLALVPEVYALAPIVLVPKAREWTVDPKKLEMIGIVAWIDVEIQLRQPGSVVVTPLYAWLAVLPRDFVARRPIVLARHVARNLIPLTMFTLFR
jgi:hypothetical protein